MSDPTSAEVLAAIEQGLPWPGGPYLVRELDAGEEFAVVASDMGPEYIEVRLKSGQGTAEGKPIQWTHLGVAVLREAPGFLPSLIQNFRQANAAMLTAT